MKKIKKLSSDSEIDFENVNKIIDAVNELQEIVGKDVKQVVNGRYTVEDKPDGPKEALTLDWDKPDIEYSMKDIADLKIGDTMQYHGKWRKVSDKRQSPGTIEQRMYDVSYSDDSTGDIFFDGMQVAVKDKPEPEPEPEPKEDPPDLIKILLNVRSTMHHYLWGEALLDDEPLTHVIRYLEGIEERKREAIKLLDSRKLSLTTLEKAIKAI